MEWEKAGSVYARGQSGLTADERMASLFQPDTLLSTQHFENFRSKVLPEPEKRLMLAILEDAVSCFQENLLAMSGKRKRLFQEAEKWIVEVGGDWIVSFETVCETLGINSAYVRLGLLRWKEKKIIKGPRNQIVGRKKDGRIDSRSA